MGLAFVKVAAVEDIPQGTSACFDVEGRRVAVFHLADGFYAIDDNCSHDEASLSAGEIINGTVACPRHGAKFDIATGRALTLPAVLPVDTFKVKVEDGSVFVDVS